MKITDIRQLEELNKIIPRKPNIDEWYSGTKLFDSLKYTCKNHGIKFNDCIIYAVNIFLDEQKNKYKNTRPLPCIIKYGSHFWDGDSNYCLLTIENDIWTKYYRYNCIEKIDDIILNGETPDKGKPSFIHKFPNLVLFTNEKEAKEYIKQFKYNHNLKKYTERLHRINNEIDILTKEKNELEKLINKILIANEVDN